MELTKEAIQYLIGLGTAQLGTPRDLKNGDQYILVPEGYEVESWEANKHGLTPYISAHPRFSSVESFITYVKEFRTESVWVFGNESTITALLDYHGKEKPNRLTHQAILNLAKTPEWDRWLTMNGRSQQQTEFAEFLEENQFNVMEPEGAKLIEIITTLESKTNVEFKSQVRTSDGTLTLAYSENQETTGGRSEKLPLPTKIKVGLPVFRGYKDGEGKPALFPLEFFLRSRIAGGKAQFIIKADNPERVVQAALGEIYQRIEADLGLKILEGTL